MILTVIICVALVAIDQILKYLVLQHLAPIGVASVIPGFAGLRYVENDGMAFNMLSGMQPLLIVVTGIVLAVVGFIIFSRKVKYRPMVVGLIMIFSGGVGNLIDRIARGFVVDYIEFLFVDFAVFNFADSLVSIGFVVLIIAYIRYEYINAKKKKALEAGGSTDGID